MGQGGTITRLGLLGRGLARAPRLRGRGALHQRLRHHRQATGVLVARGHLLQHRAPRVQFGADLRAVRTAVEAGVIGDVPAAPPDAQPLRRDARGVGEDSPHTALGQAAPHRDQAPRLVGRTAPGDGRSHHGVGQRLTVLVVRCDPAVLVHGPVLAVQPHLAVVQPRGLHDGTVGTPALPHGERLVQRFLGWLLGHNSYLLGSRPRYAPAA